MSAESRKQAAACIDDGRKLSVVSDLTRTQLRIDAACRYLMVLHAVLGPERAQDATRSIGRIYRLGWRNPNSLGQPFIGYIAIQMNRWRASEWSASALDRWEAVAAALPRCIMTPERLAGSVSAVAAGYCLSAAFNDLNRWQSTRTDERARLIADLNKLRDSMLGAEQSGLLLTAPVTDRAAGYSIAHFNALIAEVESAHRNAPLPRRGGNNADPALDQLIASLARIYRHATGELPKISRDVNNNLSGAYLGFWLAATDKDMFRGAAPTAEAIYKRMRRLGLTGARAKSSAIDAHTSDATHRATMRPVNTDGDSHERPPSRRSRGSR